MLSKLTKPQLSQGTKPDGRAEITRDASAHAPGYHRIPGYKEEVKHAYTPNPNRGYHRNNVAYRQTYCNQQSFVRDQ